MNNLLQQSSDSEWVNVVILAGQNPPLFKNKKIQAIFNKIKWTANKITDGEEYLTDYKPLIKIWEETILERQIKALSWSWVDNIIIVWIAEKIQKEVDKILQKEDFTHLKDKIQIVDQGKDFWENAEKWLKKSRELNNKDKITTFITWDLPFITSDWIDKYITEMKKIFSENQDISIIFTYILQEDIHRIKRKYFNFLLEDDGSKKWAKEQNIFSVRWEVDIEKIKEIFAIRKLRNPINIFLFFIKSLCYIPASVFEALTEIITYWWIKRKTIVQALNDFFKVWVSSIKGRDERFSIDNDSKEDNILYKDNFFEKILNWKYKRLSSLDITDKKWKYKRK